MPMFERQGASGYKEGLENTITLDAHFGHPHRNYRTIHIAGTNGKGSCSHTIAAILQACGHKVGLYTSPHLKDFRERIRINGKCISEDYVVDFIERERAFFEPLHPSFFELTTSLAFKYFSDMKVDYAVIEVGLGGRLDCTNIITPIISVITNISLDHTQFLGNTIQEIAMEKAGIIKKGVPVVIGEQVPETRHVFEAKAKEMDAPILFADELREVKSATPIAGGGILYDTAHYGVLRGDLSGFYQVKNANTVLSTISALNDNRYAIPAVLPKGKDVQEIVRQAFADVARTTGLMGRWQKISENPTVICDTGHNVGGWLYIGEQLRHARCNRIHVIFGMVNDKDVDEVLSLLPRDATFYFTRPSTKRAIPESMIRDKANAQGLDGKCHPTVCDAFMAAKEAATKDDLIFIGGSSYIVADFLTHCF